MTQSEPIPSWCTSDGRDIVIRIKALPGASRDQIAGTIGDRLKIRVSAPPEGGRANRAICTLLARSIGVRAGDVVVEIGRTNPLKTVRIAGCSVDRVRALAAEE